jgi:hypothetical protein
LSAAGCTDEKAGRRSLSLAFITVNQHFNCFFMSYEPYPDLEALPDLSVFQFVSVGTQGRITKQIQFNKLNEPELYLLQLGDVTEQGAFNRATISNNGDMNRIFAISIF